MERYESVLKCRALSHADSRPWFAVDLGPPENAQQRPVGLLRMISLDQQGLGEQGGLRANLCRPAFEPFRTPFGELPVIDRHVFPDGDAFAAANAWLCLALLQIL